MTPEEFEHYVAKIYEAKGYTTKVSPYTNDWGIDVIAIKDDQKIGIQVKRYGTKRKVNRSMIMELYGAAAFQDCTSAVIVTDGDILPDAIEVAKKLKVEVLKLSPNGQENNLTDSNVNYISVENKEVSVVSEDSKSNYPTFYEAWKKYIMPLKGHEIEGDGLKILLKM